MAIECLGSLTGVTSSRRSLAASSVLFSWRFVMRLGSVPTSGLPFCLLACHF